MVNGINASADVIESFSTTIDTFFSLFVLAGLLMLIYMAFSIIAHVVRGTQEEPRRRIVVEGDKRFMRLDADNMYRKRPRIERQTESTWRKLKRWLFWGL